MSQRITSSATVLVFLHGIATPMLMLFGVDVCLSYHFTMTMKLWRFMISSEMSSVAYGLRCGRDWSYM